MPDPPKSNSAIAFPDRDRRHAWDGRCPICEAPRDRLITTTDDCRCDSCGSFAADRAVRAALKGDLSKEIEFNGARMLLFGISDCQASHLFGEAELYRCDSTEKPSTDLIVESASFSSLPDACFDAVVANDLSVALGDLGEALSEVHRLLMPGGLFLMMKKDSAAPQLGHRFRENARVVRSIDVVTGQVREIHVGRKDTTPLDAHTPPVLGGSGYAYHLSRKTGRRIVFCLEGPAAAGEQRPVLSEVGEVVGQVTLGSSAGEYVKPSEPWREGFRLPPRGTYDLDPSLPSGVYSLDGKIPFVHRLGRPASVAVLLPSNTAVAFNPAGAGASTTRWVNRPPMSSRLSDRLSQSYCSPSVGRS